MAILTYKDEGTYSLHYLLRYIIDVCYRSSDFGFVELTELNSVNIGSFTTFIKYPDLVVLIRATSLSLLV